MLFMMALPGTPVTVAVLNALNVMFTVGAQNVTGIKTFMAGALPLLTDRPTTALQAANKAYVDQPFLVIMPADDLEAIIEAAANDTAFWLAPGNHVLAGEVALTADRVSIWGDRGAVVQYAANRAFDITGEEAHFHGFTIDATNVACGHAIELAATADGGLFQMLTFLGIAGMAGDAINWGNVSVLDIFRCRILATNRGLVGATATYVSLYGNILVNCIAEDIHIGVGGDYTEIRNNRLVNNIALNSLILVDADRCKVIGNEVDASGGVSARAIDISGDYNVVDQNNVQRSPALTSIRVTGNNNHFINNGYAAGTFVDTGVGNFRGANRLWP